MIVFRLECKNRKFGSVELDNVNIGPYLDNNWNHVSEVSESKLDNIGSILDSSLGFSSDVHPLPEDDEILSITYDDICHERNLWVFCFDTLDQLYTWFINMKEINNINEYLRIGVYQIDDIDYMKGKTQSIMKACNCMLIDTVTIEV